MRILFWNTGKRPVADLLRDISRRRELDVLVLAETADPIERLVSQLNRDAERVYFSAPDPLAKSVKRPLHILTRLPGDRVRAVQDSDGVMVRQVFPVIGPDFTIVAVHLRSKLFRDQDDQVSGARYVNGDIEKAERQVGHRRTLVIGDFNMNPFERGLVNFDCFHAVMSRDTASRRSRRSDGRERCFFTIRCGITSATVARVLPGPTITEVPEKPSISGTYSTRSCFDRIYSTTSWMMALKFSRGSGNSRW